MKLSIDPMALADVPQVVEVDRDSYPTPWPASAYRRELTNQRHARYLVLREVDGAASQAEPANPDSMSNKRSWRDVLGWPRAGDGADSGRGRVLGYAGMWLVADEAHVTTIATRTTERGKGYGELLLASLIDLASDLGIRWVTLEVRVSNDIAQRLYRKYGFRNAGMRKRYYSDNNEDALIMTTDDITLHASRTQFGRLIAALQERLHARIDLDVVAPVLSYTEIPRSAKLADQS